MKAGSLRRWKSGSHLAGDDAASLGAKAERTRNGSEEQGVLKKLTFGSGRKSCRKLPGALQPPAPGHPPADKMHLSAAPGRLMALSLPRWAAGQVDLPASCSPALALAAARGPQANAALPLQAQRSRLSPHQSLPAWSHSLSRVPGQVQPGALPFSSSLLRAGAS